MPLPTRTIGADQVTAIGYGCMGLSGVYGAPLPDDDRLKILDAVFSSGCTNWDTADVYGDSEDLLGKWFKRTGKRSQIFLATKCGFDLDNDVLKNGPVIKGTPKYVRTALERSLSRLGVGQIDLWYCHRPDASVPIELTIRAMAEAVKSGKVKYIGICECSAETLRRAHAVHPIAAVQMEYSPFTLDAEAKSVGLFSAAQELGIPVVAYSPLGRGILTGKFQGPEDFEQNDGRRVMPRYSKENFPKLLQLVDALQRVGDRHAATSGQVTLAWIMAQGEAVIPIPGTRKQKYLEENLGSLKVTLSEDELKEIREAAASAGTGKIPRYPARFQQFRYSTSRRLPFGA